MKAAGDIRFLQDQVIPGKYSGSHIQNKTWERR